MSPSQRGWPRAGTIEMAVGGPAGNRGLAQPKDREDVTGSTAGHLTDCGPSGVLLAQDSARPSPAGAPGTPVLGYASVNVARPGYSPGDVRRQVLEITAACERRGLTLMRVAHDHVSPRQRPLERPGLVYALGRITAGEARGLVVSDLSRLARALPELGRVLEWLTCRDVRFIAAVPRIDTGEEAGRLVVQTIIEVSRWERQRVVEGTRAGMRAARRKGPASVTDYPELRQRISGMRAAGMTLQAIADHLNAAGVPTIRGGAKWRPSSVQAAAGYHRPSTRRSLDRHPAARIKADDPEP
jgi:DNA invertase Pin-like site-specific DNA recombinase